METFRSLYENNLLSIETLDGVIYQIGEIKLPIGKLVMGINGQFNALSAIQILTTLEEAAIMDGEIREGPNDSLPFQLFKYTTRAGQNFFIKRGPDDAALSAEEIKWLWPLL